ncbi:MAG TPA: hypothetical protein VJ044_11165, partial [Candidatus Hodarchaeales archaeon]|nr:hypothetical protein [Candidatus Hodarchaeales archaeon]
LTQILIGLFVLPRLLKIKNPKSSDLLKTFIFMSWYSGVALNSFVSAFFFLSSIDVEFVLILIPIPLMLMKTQEWNRQERRPPTPRDN